MTTQTHTENQESTTEAVSIENPNLSFSDYERLRRGEKVEVSKTKSAPEQNSAQEQNKSANSDDAETEDEVEVENDNESDGSSAKDDEQKKPKKKSGFQRKIDKVIARERVALARAQAAEERLASLERGSGDSKPVEANKSQEGKPNPDNFDTHADYVEALADWKIEQREKKREAEVEKSKLEKEHQSRFQSHLDRVKSFAETVEDFEEVIEAADDVPFSAALQGLIVESENSGALLYELAKDKKELERISKLSPLAMARELGRFESKIVGQKSSAEQKSEPNKITKAPKPISTVGSGKTVVTKSIDDPNISFADYERIRREQMKRR